MHLVSQALCHRYNGDAARRVIYTESHDEVANGHARVPEEIWPGNAGSWFSRKRSTLGAAMVFAAPGIPMIFQGQEFLEDEYFQDSVPLDWTKLDDLRRHPRALPRSDSAPPELVQSDARSPRPAAQRPSRQQRRQGSRLSPLGQWRAGRRCRGGGEFRQPQLRQLHVRVPTPRPVARAFQQRLAGIQPGLRQSAGLRHVRRRRSDGQHAVPSHGRHWPVHCPCPVAGPLRDLRQPFGTWARKRRGLSTRTRRSVASSTPAFRSMGRRPSRSAQRQGRRSSSGPGRC